MVDDDRAAMTFAERNTWLYAFRVPVTSLVYFAVAIPRFSVSPRRKSRGPAQCDWFVDRIARATTAFGAAGVLALAMFKVDPFWISHALLLLGSIGATWGSIVKIQAYRGGVRWSCQPAWPTGLA